MFELKTGVKFMNHRALNIYKSKLADAWTAEFLFVTTVAHLET
jgi:hypothetical protein